MIYYTKGLPNGTFPEKQYEFNVYNCTLTVPGKYIGRDQMGEPYHMEQKDWLNSLAPAIAVKEVWYGTWEFASLEEVGKFIKLLQSIPDRGI